MASDGAGRRKVSLVERLAHEPQPVTFHQLSNHQTSIRIVVIDTMTAADEDCMHTYSV